ncbi:hypothetical protein [Arthrobacter sp. 24S4-2]|uniref:hypothetical protein n=1 Tax=Arthrobacter sp. 24S4-2 TaxID=2575374 RepID=UPI0020C76746|nr:hypothetical protein [Arthrobacter sp. 24S4-2]
MNSDNNRPVPPNPEGTPEGQQPPANAGWGAPPSANAPEPQPTDPLATHNLPAAGWGSTRPSGGWGAPASAGSFPAGSFSAKGPDGRSKPWTRKRGLVVAGAAAVLAGGAGVGVYALTSGAAAAETATDGQALPGTAPGARGGTQGGFAGGMPAQGGPGNFAPGGLGGMGSGVSAAVHSEYVVLQDGAYVTKVEQQGTVAEVSSDSVTVKSTDGFSRTYSLGSDVVVSNVQQRRQQAGGTSTSQLTVADIVSGATVRIVAGKDSNGFPAESVQLVAATLTGQSN